MSNLQPNCCLEFDFRKVDQHAGGKWLIHFKCIIGGVDDILMKLAYDKSPLVLFGAIWHQAIAWIRIDRALWNQMASQGEKNLLTHWYQMLIWIIESRNFGGNKLTDRHNYDLSSTKLHMQIYSSLIKRYFLNAR